MKKKLVIIIVIITIMFCGCSKASVNDIYSTRSATTKNGENQTEVSTHIAQDNSYKNISVDIKKYNLGETATVTGSTSFSSGQKKFSVTVEKVMIGDNLNDIRQLIDEESANRFSKLLHTRDFDITINEDGSMQSYCDNMDMNAVFVKLKITNNQSETLKMDLKQLELYNLSTVNGSIQILKTRYANVSMIDKFQTEDSWCEWYSFAPGETLETVVMFPYERELVLETVYKTIKDSNNNIISDSMEVTKKEDNPLKNVYLYADLNGNSQMQDGDCFMELGIVDGQVVKE